ncbi:hypothetical protein [Kosakonia phage 305]|uniref:Uncharacterized protein n=1 Tax=Kosakonia phage 305 TaxID=2863193 RepID=A0AAE8BES3_9CAUD|nr:hypothetical protein PP421_gp105 [Kosakonia phage 305]YP_010650644.1 hypothetical protein PP425_gp104 [Enterobacter phage vB_EclM_Q7622]QYN80256.1 hypothetical protein [Kosakonia phage 305]UIS65619.1 hypothetical protein Q76222_00104 [Enterobacter phage vB_EclM_Q7622]
MTAILLAQLWWFMPIFLVGVYFTIGFLITKAFIKNEHIHSVADWWFWFVLWLPAFCVGGLWSALAWLAKLPKRIAENQINKQ